MALTIVLGLTVLSVANYGSTYELAGQIKPTIKPFSTLTNQHYQGDQFKSAFGYNSVPPKPFGAPFEHFKQPYQPYQPFRANYQPFGPYPGYPGPVVYPGHGGYQGPEAYRFDEPHHKPFGFQPFPAPAQPAFNQYKFGPAKKFNKNFPGLADFNQPGKYFQEHQFGAYHGPEFSSAIVPAEHNIKQSRPKDTLLGKPFEFGLPKQTSFGFPSPPSFGYPVPNFPPVQPFVSTVPSVKSVPATLIPVNAVKVEQKFGGAEVTTAVIPSSSAQDDSATVEQQSVEVTGEPLAVTPAAADAQPSPAQEEITSGGSSDAQVPSAEVSINNEVPAGELSYNYEVPSGTVPVDDRLVSSSEAPINNEAPAVTVQVDDGLVSSSEAPTDNEAPAVSIPIDGEVNAVQDSAAVAPAQEQSAAPSSEGNEPSNVGSEQTGSVPETQDSAVVQEPSPVVVSEEVKDTSSAAPVQASNEPSESSTVSGPAKSEGVPAENKPETGSAAVNLPGLPVELQNTQFGPVPISDTSSLGQFGSSGFPYFGQSAGAQQPSYYPYFDAPGFSEEELKAFAANFATSVPSQSGQVLGTSATPAANIPQGISISNPSAEIATLIESGNNAKSQDKATASDEKQITSGSPSPATPLSDAPKTQSKFNSVQIVQNDPFNGQLPLLYDPSSAAAPLDTYKFYSHPSVSKWASQASLASYSPESAFSNFGSQFQQGYLVEGSPTLTPLTKTVVQSSQIPLSISSLDHPLHSQVFKYSQSFVPYPGLVAGNNAAAYQPFDVSSSTATPAAASVTTAEAAAADVSVQSTSTPEVAVESSSSTSAPAEESA